MNGQRLVAEGVGSGGDDGGTLSYRADHLERRLAQLSNRGLHQLKKGRVGGEKAAAEAFGVTHDRLEVEDVKVRESGIRNTKSKI